MWCITVPMQTCNTSPQEGIMAATVLLTCAGFLAISVVFGFIGAKLSD